jgi:hypothetical protein
MIQESFQSQKPTVAFWTDGAKLRFRFFSPVRLQRRDGRSLGEFWESAVTTRCPCRVCSLPLENFQSRTLGLHIGEHDESGIQAEDVHEKGMAG